MTNQDGQNLIIVLSTLIENTEEEMKTLDNPMQALNVGYRLDKQREALRTAKELLTIHVKN